MHSFQLFHWYLLLLSQSIVQSNIVGLSVCCIRYFMDDFKLEADGVLMASCNHCCRLSENKLWDLLKGTNNKKVTSATSCSVKMDMLAFYKKVLPILCRIFLKELLNLIGSWNPVLDPPRISVCLRPTFQKTGNIPGSYNTAYTVHMKI